MTIKKEDCCKGCKNGRPGQNKSCQAKLMMEHLAAQKETQKGQQISN